MAQIDQFLKVLVEQGGSDLHLTVGSPPVMRVHGHLQRIKFRELSQADMEALVYEIMEEDWRITFIDRKDYDFVRRQIRYGYCPTPKIPPRWQSPDLPHADGCECEQCVRTLPSPVPTHHAPPPIPPVRHLGRDRP